MIRLHSFIAILINDSMVCRILSDKKITLHSFIVSLTNDWIICRILSGKKITSHSFLAILTTSKQLLYSFSKFISVALEKGDHFFNTFICHYFSSIFVYTFVSDYWASWLLFVIKIIVRYCPAKKIALLSNLTIIAGYYPAKKLRYIAS